MASKKHVFEQLNKISYREAVVRPWLVFPSRFKTMNAIWLYTSTCDEHLEESYPHESLSTPGAKVKLREPPFSA